MAETIVDAEEDVVGHQDFLGPYMLGPNNTPENGVYCGNALAISHNLPDGCVDLILTDPPYYKVKNEWWDRQWDRPNDFLSWIGELCNEWQRILKANGSLYLFASPQMTDGIKAIVGEYFNILNTIRWYKDAGWHKKTKEETLRSYLKPWEAVIFAEQRFDQYADNAKALHKEVFAPIGHYIQTERELAGFTRNDVEVRLGYVSSSDSGRGTALCYRWEEGSSIPTKETYHRLRLLLNEQVNEGDKYLRREYEDLRREYEDLRRPFNRNGIISDLWTYAPVMNFPGKHPAEKPLRMMEDTILTSTQYRGVVTDFFVGRGTVAEAASNTGRYWLCCDISQHWTEKARLRLSQPPLFTLEPTQEKMELQE